HRARADLGRPGRPDAHLRHVGVQGRHRRQRFAARRVCVALHVPDPRVRGDLHPARRHPARQRELKMSHASMKADRRKALVLSYFFLCVFVVFFLTPPVYMLITSLKSNAEISSAAAPWWILNPTLENYFELLTTSTYLTFFRNSAVVSLCVVAITMAI